jgi:hypothetical protein
MNLPLTPQHIFILGLCAFVALCFLYAAIRNFFLWRKTPTQHGELVAYRHMGAFAQPCPIMKFNENGDIVQTEIINMALRAPEGTKARIKRKGNKHIKLKLAMHITGIFSCSAIFHGLIFSQIEVRDSPHIYDIIFWAGMSSTLAAFVFGIVDFVIIPLIENIQSCPHKNNLAILMPSKAPKDYNQQTKQDLKAMKKGDTLSYKQLCAYNHYSFNHPVIWIIIIIASLYLLNNIVGLLSL